MISKLMRRLRWRPHAGRLVAWMAVSFGLTVVITRLFLMSSGYPKIGGHTYHIAHALFGGLLLVIAVLLTLLYAGTSVITVAAVLSGVGLGLFIDEVGKFITTDNNYFFPLAAPIIYFAFLLIVAVARYAAHTHRRSPEVHLSEVMEQVAQVVGTRPDTDRRSALITDLNSIQRHALPSTHIDVLDALSRYLHAAPDCGHASIEARIVPATQRLENVLAPRQAVRLLLITVMLGHAVWSLLRLALTAEVLTGWHPAWHQVGRLLESAQFQHHGWRAQLGLVIAALAELAVGLGFVAASIEWLRGREPAAVRWAIWSSVLSLTVVNVMATYFDQFLTVFTAIGEALVLGLLIRYRSRFIPMTEWHRHHQGVAATGLPDRELTPA